MTSAPTMYLNPLGDTKISPEYLAMQKELHATGEYDVVGNMFAGPVHTLALQLSRKYSPISILDYRWVQADEYGKGDQ